MTMKHILKSITLLLAAALFSGHRADACTNIIVGKAASTDGSVICSYNCDGNAYYGYLWFYPGGVHQPGEMAPVHQHNHYENVTYIPQVERTYSQIGYINENQVTIVETTSSGRKELHNPNGIFSYRVHMNIALQRSRTAREAIDIVARMTAEHGYNSTAEILTICDKNEAWIMEIIGKGPDTKGAVWVAVRIPDDCICAHANVVRVRDFPQTKKVDKKLGYYVVEGQCMYSADCISFAREKGYFSGEDKDFSFREAYCPLDFGTVRGCDARVWSAFNILCDGNFEGRSSYDWINYAMGGDLKGELPLWVKPARKISPKDVADVMRDHFEGTPMDMTKDIGAGGNALPYRWRPMDFVWEGRTYCNERAIATQQTGFWFVAQARGWLPDCIGALLWFGCDDAATSYLTPIYCCTAQVPECLREGNGDLLHYSASSQFWICNRVAQACYKMYDRMAPVVREAIDKYEKLMMFELIPSVDVLMLEKKSEKQVRRSLTAFTVQSAQKQFDNWKALEELLLVKFIDGNVKAQNPDGSFTHSKWSEGIPDKLIFAGYNDVWKAAVAKEHGKTIEVK